MTWGSHKTNLSTCELCAIHKTNVLYKSSNSSASLDYQSPSITYIVSMWTFTKYNAHTISKTLSGGASPLMSIRMRPVEHTRTDWALPLHDSRDLVTLEPGFAQHRSFKMSPSSASGRQIWSPQTQTRANTDSGLKLCRHDRTKGGHDVDLSLCFWDGNVPQT